MKRGDETSCQRRIKAADGLAWFGEIRRVPADVLLRFAIAERSQSKIPPSARNRISNSMAT